MVRRKELTVTEAREHSLPKATEALRADDVARLAAQTSGARNSADIVRPL